MKAYVFYYAPCVRDINHTARGQDHVPIDIRLFFYMISDAPLGMCLGGDDKTKEDEKRLGYIW